MMSRLCLVLLLPISCQTSYTRGMRLGLSNTCQPWQYPSPGLKSEEWLVRLQTKQSHVSPLALGSGWATVCCSTSHCAWSTKGPEYTHTWIQDTNCIPGDPTVALQAHHLIVCTCVILKLPFAMRLDASSLPRENVLSLSLIRPKNVSLEPPIPRT